MAIFALMLISVNSVQAQDLIVANNNTVTISSNSAYNDISLGQNSTLNILPGVAVDAVQLIVLNNAVINLDGILNITGDVSVSNKADLTVNSTGVMDVGGSVSAGNNSTLDMGGTVSIGGNLDASRSNIIVDGNVVVGGNFTGTVDSGSGTLASGNANNYNQPLPVVLIYANIDFDNGEVKVNWATSAEINNDYFSIKISKDLNDWKEVAQVRGFGNTSSTTEYDYGFMPEYSGQVYVQLSQTDYDGTTEVLKVMVVNVKGGQYRVYPNPMREGQKLNIKGISSTDNVKVFNSAMVPVENIDNLERGFYYVVINDSNVQKLIVK